MWFMSAQGSSASHHTAGRHGTAAQGGAGLEKAAACKGRGAACHTHHGGATKGPLQAVRRPSLAVLYDDVVNPVGGPQARSIGRS